ncbi:MAG: bifunctional (p)ppGpp synthetase/guanosine-3',5'-bis(diphosphate) 3'-pyrophosphohydrolase [Clostridiales bacterium]|jgi:guanosine-3',5'-bis(diphosphate) 3'-pyrophosphohydrolase|nr:bifunctional (p)ppGpp synthetase/guanosine-3',5'-bis(diphosphate) 3'-pyrophosphohydrolase [Clostridiales bacterium]
MDKVFEQYLALEEKVKGYNPNLNIERLRAAYELSRNAHGDQKRKDGSPFVTHPIAAAEITADMGLDEDAIIACLLHDTIEDTDVTYEDIAKKFGVTVADIVEGVTKLTRVVYTSKEEEQVENLRKMLMAMAKDIRVILIKIADRLHNLRTLNYQSQQKQMEKSLESVEIYAPIAHRLGIQKAKWELEDLSLIYIDPIAYEEITSQIDSRRDIFEEFMNTIKSRISARLESYNIKASVSSRLKHIYSIYRKMYSQNKDLSQVFDLCAFRVIVDSVSDCYNVLGHMHDLFKPIPGKFKDYISTPKPNMYQSIHTTVIGSEGIPFEIQIRTWEMHHTAEYGVAAHWKYKSEISGNNQSEEEKYAWIRSLLESQQDTDAHDFVKEFKIDMFADEVFVFTPKGDVIILPANATPIDFAYKIHSAVGNSMVGAKVNGKLVPFDHILKNGDIVEIITSKSSKGPGRDWINIAKSSEARGKIKQWFKKEKREENIAHGKSAFEAEMKRNHLSISEFGKEEIMQAVLKKLSFGSLDEMYAAIGFGGITAVRAVSRVREELIKARKQDRQEKQPVAPPPIPPARDKSVKGIMVEGLENCLIKFARCCTPVPGDDVLGFITKGYGVSVHRTKCQNYLNSRARGEDEGRWIKVAWGNTEGETYQTALTVSADDRNGLIVDIATALGAVKTKITSLNVREVGNGKALAFITIEVKDLAALQTAMNRLRIIPGVSDVERPGVNR